MQKAGAVLLPSPLASGLPWFASFCWEKKKKRAVSLRWVAFLASH